MCRLAAQCDHVVDVEFLRKGLHDAGQGTMLENIQRAVDEVSAQTYDAILLGYGRCNNGIAGLRANDLPLVIPRAHDCITFFFGGRDRYEEYFFQNPGTYYRTTCRPG